jgi:O-antigen/teichoic acid export membrane protein
MWRKIGGAALAKILVMGLSGLLAILTGRLIIQNFGTDAYAQYGLLSTIPALLPFADLGVGAVVINAVSSSSSIRTDDHARRAIVSALRILAAAGFVLIGLALIVTLTGAWPILLGSGITGTEGGIAAFLCMVVFGLAMPLAVGQRVLVGLNKTSTQVAAQAVVAPFMLVSIGLVVFLSVPAGSFLAVFSYAGMALVSVICLIVAGRSIRPQLGRALRETPFPKKYPGVPTLSMAWPVLIQMIALPVAMQTDRLLISHLTDGTELAEYNLASQLFGMALQTIAAAGLALWPIFAKARADGDIRSPLTLCMWFLAGGLLLALSLAVIAPILAGFMSDGAIVLDGWLVGGFVVFVALQAAKYPTGMYMTDFRGLRFQVLPVIIMIPISLALSWWLIGLVGPGGAIIGSAIAVLVCQVIPNLWYVMRDLEKRRLAAAGQQQEAEEEKFQLP